jgi:hypothetical protein
MILIPHKNKGRKFGQNRIGILFREGFGLEGRLLRDRGGSCPWTHVGVFWGRPGRGVVYHADPHAGHHGRVTLDTLAAFTDPARARSWACYQIAEVNQPDAIRRWCAARVDEGIPFDHTYDLSDPTTMYCTEYVWRAALAEGVTLCDGPYTLFRLPIMGPRSIMLPEHLFQKGGLQPWFGSA